MVELKNNGTFKAETAGSIMVKEYITVEDHVTIKQAIEHLRNTVGSMKNIHYVYITDEERHVVGALSIRELLSADDELNVRDVMITDTITLPKKL